jgi:hypothetical protein
MNCIERGRKVPCQVEVLFVQQALKTATDNLLGYPVSRPACEGTTPKYEAGETTARPPFRSEGGGRKPV